MRRVLRTPSWQATPLLSRPASSSTMSRGRNAFSTRIFYMPPEIRVVELMSCGKTDPGIIDFLMERFSRYGLAPFRVQNESVGFIFNRIWAAIKRESLAVVAEGVS